VSPADSVPAALAAVRARIDAAARACGRDPAGVTLVAVSKLQPEPLIRAAYACGQRDFGENYVQELLGKREALADLTEVRWHLIGHLQRNKAKYVAPFVHVAHTVDDLDLGAELGRRARAAGRVLDALVQVNVGGEAQKSGCAPGDLAALLRGRGTLSFALCGALGLVAGSALWHRRRGRLHLERHRGLHEFARSLTVGVLLAVGGVAALGCTVGQGVTGLSTLAVGAALATLATLAGALLALRVEYALTRID